jgi:hypothetical protein
MNFLQESSLIWVMEDYHINVMYMVNTYHQLITCISSVSGPHRPITPYVKPFFPSSIVQSTVTNYGSYTFSSCFTFVRVFLALFARASRFNHVFTL